MKKRIVKRIVKLIRRAQRLASKIGVPNILQPGLVKEMIVADLLGHIFIPSKRDADAYHPNAPHLKYEYLSCYEGGTGQIDRMFARPPEKRERSMRRILRNSKIYLAVFYKKKPTEVKTIYELEPKMVAEEAARQLDNSKNPISHVSFPEKWAKEKGKIIYENRR